MPDEPTYEELEQKVKELKKESAQRKLAEGALKQAYQELKNTQAQLIQSAKFAFIGELASGVAHELNQPLMVIRATAQIMQRYPGKGALGSDKLSDNIQSIEKNTKRMMNIINHFRTFCRYSESEFYPVDINKIIEDCFLMVGEQLRLQTIEVKKDLSRDLPKIQGNSNQLEQVLLNMITNAMDAIERRRLGKIEGPECDSQKVDRIKTVSRVSDDNRGVVEILIKDNGSGISVKNLEKVFDPFFTTKEVGIGTGLGLSICHGIIKDHNGEIEVTETGQDGTTFRIKLPVGKT